jgi:hypothetical protein
MSMGLLERIKNEMESQKVAEQGDSQPLPTEGKRDVFPEMRAAFLKMYEERMALGIQRYGRTLQTHNGRNVGVDVLEELFDAFAYAMQFVMEHSDLGRQMQQYRDEAIMLRQRTEAVRDFILNRTLVTDQATYSLLTEIADRLDMKQLPSVVAE